jgi:hypothetical protein
MEAHVEERHEPNETEPPQTFAVPRRMSSRPLALGQYRILSKMNAHQVLDSC